MHISPNVSRLNLIKIMSRSRNIRLLDYMDWFVGDMPRTQRARNVFGEGGRQSSSKATTNGRRRLQELYDSKSRTSKFEPHELDEFRQIFEFYDVDNTKTMDLEDLIMALRALGYNPTEKDANDVIRLMEVDDDTTLDFSEFCMVIEFLNHVTGEAGELRNAFRLVAQDEGHVKSNDVIQMMTTHSEDMSLKQINEMVKFADKDRSGVINYDQLVDDIIEDKAKIKRQDNSEDNLMEPVYYKNDKSKFKNKCQTASTKKKNKAETRNVEAIDSLVKALGGPILMVSAVIITCNKQPENKWIKAKNLIKKLKPQLAVTKPKDCPSTST